MMMSVDIFVGLIHDSLGRQILHQKILRLLFCLYISFVSFNPVSLLAQPIVPPKPFLRVTPPIAPSNNEPVRLPDFRSYLEKEATSPVKIPHFDTIHAMKEALYHLQFNEKRDALFQQIQALPPLYQDALRPLYHYMLMVTTQGAFRQASFEQFDESATQAQSTLEQALEDQPEKSGLKALLGLIMGMRVNVALAYQRSMWAAWRHGQPALVVMESLQERHPDFHDTRISQGILRVTVAHASWWVKLFAPILLTRGTLEEGLDDLFHVAQNGVYANDEAHLFMAFLMLSQLPQDWRLKMLDRLQHFVVRYPNNPQLYWLIAHGYRKANRALAAQVYANRGLRCLEATHTQFLDRQRDPMRAALLVELYQALIKRHHFRTLLRIAKRQHDPTLITPTYQAVAWWRLNQKDKARALAQTTLKQFEDQSLELPLFMIPYQYKVHKSTVSLLEEMLK